MNYNRSDFDHSPLLVFYEVTRACDLLCRHCRAKAQRRPHRDELDGTTSLRLLEQLTDFPKPPLLVFTGGDPIKRSDVFELVEHAGRIGLRTAMTPSATPLVTDEAIRRLSEAGLHRLAVSLDAADEWTHDDFRRVPGSFQRTLEIIAAAHSYGLPVQINTTVSRHNVDQIDQMADLLATLDIELWSVFFLVPTGRARSEERLSGVQCEAVFLKLWEHSLRQPYAIKTTEAPHFRRFVMQHLPPENNGHNGLRLPHHRLPLVGTNDGKGVMFISHTGEIYPSGFLPISCGKFPLDSVVRVYQEAALFQALRDPDRLGGKCGVCDYRWICGGSRARAFAISGDPLAAEPDCIYGSPLWRQEAIACSV